MAKQQVALEPKEKAPFISTDGESFFELFKNTTEAIGQRAFELFEKRGRQFGYAIEDWLRAESELVRRVPVAIKEVNGNLEIRAEVPGFKAEEIKVCVEPRRLTISGEMQESTEKGDEKTLYSEWRSQKMFRAFDLPLKVKTTDTKAMLKDGVLSLTLPKAEVLPPQEIPVKTE